MCLGQAFSALPAQLLATLLIQYERLRGVQSSGVLIIFWLLCVICAIIPFRSKILSAVAEVRGSDLPGLALLRSALARLKVTVESRLPHNPRISSLRHLSCSSSTYYVSARWQEVGDLSRAGK